MRIARGMLWAVSGAILAMVMFAYLWGLVANLMMPMG